MKYFINTKSNGLFHFDYDIISEDDENTFEISKELYEEVIQKRMHNYKCIYHIDNGKLTISFELDNEMIVQEKESKLRTKRAPLLQAFDIYKSNVAYGIIVESEVQHKEIVVWYNNILELDEKALNNVPIEVSRYL